MFKQNFIKLSAPRLMSYRGNREEKPRRFWKQYCPRFCEQ